MINQAKQAKDRRGWTRTSERPGRWESQADGFKLEWRTARRCCAMEPGRQDFLFREYERLREALGGTAHKLADQFELQRIGHPYYNSRSGGGEGHLEVAKNIYYCNKDLAHMVLSLKPFGCMPSTQSDGAQAGGGGRTSRT
jgi:hypothetical protein